MKKNKKNWLDRFIEKHLSSSDAIIGICLVLIFIGSHIYHKDIINGDQLGYTGAIIGGGMTLVGVLYTIEYEKSVREIDKKERNQERLQELSAQYKPILKVTIPVNEEEKEIKLRKDINSFYINLLLYIENIGRGECLDITTTYSSVPDEFNDMTYLSVCSNFEKIIISSIEMECLPATDKRQVMIQMIVDNDFKDYDILTFNMDLTFHDAFSRTKLYKHSAKVVLRNNMFLNKKEDGYSVLVTNHYKNGGEKNGI